jgi:transcriptional regulator with XRE-family HTH domain
MDPLDWRQEAGLTLKDLATKCGKGISTVRRYETGEKEAPNGVALIYERTSGGKVTSEDFARVRKQWLRKNDTKSA